MAQPPFQTMCSRLILRSMMGSRLRVGRGQRLSNFLKHGEHKEHNEYIEILCAHCVLYVLHVLFVDLAIYSLTYILMLII